MQDACLYKDEWHPTTQQLLCYLYFIYETPQSKQRVFAYSILIGSNRNLLISSPRGMDDCSLIGTPSHIWFIVHQQWLTHSLFSWWQVWPLSEPDGRLEEGGHSPQGKHKGHGDQIQMVTHLMVMMSNMCTNCVAVIFHVCVFHSVHSWLYMFSGVCHRCLVRVAVYLPSVASLTGCVRLGIMIKRFASSIVWDSRCKNNTSIPTFRF